MHHERPFSSKLITTTKGVQSPPLEAVLEEIPLIRTGSSVPRIISLAKKSIKRQIPTKVDKQRAVAVPYPRMNAKNESPNSSKPSSLYGYQNTSRVRETNSKGVSTTPIVELAPTVYYRTRTSFLRERNSSARTSSTTSTISKPSVTSDSPTFRKLVMKSKRIGISESRPLLPQIIASLTSSKESLKNDGKIYTMVYNVEQASHDLFSLDSILESRWIITEKLPSDCHVQMYKAYDTSLEKEVIVKAAQNRNYSLDTESALLRALESRENILKYIFHEENAKVPFLVAELEGPNFEDIKRHYGPLSINTVINVGMRMLDAVEKLHARGWVHTDIKPSCFTIGNHPHKWRQITLNDYGLSRRAVRGRISHVAPENKIGIFSDPQFVSVNVLNGDEFDKRDDLWSLVYVLLYLKSDKLPWSSHTDINIIRDLKHTNISDVIVKHLGATFKKMVYILNNLKYGERPDYTKIANVFMKMRQYYTLSALDKFEWENNPDRMWVLRDPPNPPR